jgi:hypothetical protein
MLAEVRSGNIRLCQVSSAYVSLYQGSSGNSGYIMLRQFLSGYVSSVQFSSG